MHIGVIHLTDLHINSSFEIQMGDIVKAVMPEFTNTKSIYIVISGDIVDKGNGFEYAKVSLSQLKKSLERFFEGQVVRYIIVPGNHDCVFPKEGQMRNLLLENLRPSSISCNDNSIINTCIEVQEDYWRFYQEINDDLPMSKLVYQIDEIVEGHRISFNCYNTAWMSKIDEEVGKMIFPCKMIPEEIVSKENEFAVSVFHHPISWFNPSTEPNNKKEFGHLLAKTSDILLYGHEHEGESLKSLDIESNEDCLFISGEQLSKGFNALVVNVTNKNVRVIRYQKRRAGFIKISDKGVAIEKSSAYNRDFIHLKDHRGILEKLNLPLKFEARSNVQLSEIFVFPDLDKISRRNKHIDEVYDSLRVLSESANIISLEGDVQSGKSSLLNMLYLHLIDKNFYPLMISGKTLMKNNFQRAIKSCFEEQYEDRDDVYEEYRQYDLSKKIVFIDNLHEYTNNTKLLIAKIKELKSIFGKIIFSTNAMYTQASALSAEFEDLEFFIIEPLGYKKRSELIERYHLLNESESTITEQIILQKTKNHFDQIQLVLGNRLIPSYPVYILSILQTLLYANSPNIEQTSLGYCYQSLIYIALVGKAKIKNEDVDSYFNFLAELAYSLYETDLNTFSEKYLDDFYALYSQKYVTTNLSSIKDNLIEANIIVENEEGDFQFKFNYIFYFLISRKIVDLINTKQGNEIITKLCNNLSNEKDANVLIFTTHHSKDDYLIDEATLSLMSPYESYAPITLKVDDAYYTFIESIATEISSNIIKDNKDPKEVRDKRLEERDKMQSRISNQVAEVEKNLDDISDEEYNKLVEEMMHALKSVEIVGQIIKNRKGSIDKQKLKDIIKELYFTAFRTITFFGEICQATQDELIESFKAKIDENDTSADIDAKIKKFFRYMTFQQCLGVFSKVVYSVGNKDLKDIFLEVSEEIDTPAAHLVTFSIKSSYERIKLADLKRIAKELENNPVALSILRARMRAYVYNNHLEYREKQQIASALDMRMISG